MKYFFFGKKYVDHFAKFALMIYSYLFKAFITFAANMFQRHALKMKDVQYKKWDNLRTFQSRSCKAKLGDLCKHFSMKISISILKVSTSFSILDLHGTIIVPWDSLMIVSKKKTPTG